MAARETIAVRLDPQQAKTLRRAARQSGRVVSALLREIIEKALAEQQAGAAQ